MKKLILLLVVFGLSLIHAQSQSIFSKYGYGLPEHTGSARLLGMGEAGFALSDINYLNVANPATWSNLVQTRIESGIFITGNRRADANTSSIKGSGQFSGFSIGFPVYDPYGISFVFGLQPETGMDYKLQQKVVDANFTDGGYTAQYNGSGGLNKIFLGTSYRLPIGLSLGVSFEYVFGSLTTNKEVLFVSEDVLNTYYTDTEESKGSRLNLAVLSPNIKDYVGLSSFYSVRVSAGYTLGTSLSSTVLSVFGNNLFRDTSGTTSSEFDLPSRLNAGVAIGFNERTHLAIDYTMQDYSKFTYNVAGNAKGFTAFKIGAGLEYREVVAPGEVNSMVYRAGIGYEQLPFKINNSQLDELSASIGMSIPINPGNSVDLALQYVTRGNTGKLSVKEDIIRFGFGLSLGEIWFFRPER